MEKITVVSVVRNIELYEKLVKNNPHYINAEFVMFDNRDENLSISKRYNSFLQNIKNQKKDEWLVFCHEDWELLCNLQKILSKAGKNYIYGVGGTNYNSKKNIVIWYGNIIQSNKDCSKTMHWGKSFSLAKLVDTVDCQCIIFHSSLIEKYDLTFDENLMFDFYAEDFCINADEKYGIKTMVLPVKCHHYSYGNFSANFEKSVNYTKQKYQNLSRFYSSCCTNALLPGEPSKIIRLSVLGRLQRKLGKITGVKNGK